MTGLIILAAGSSSRLGQPKQKLIYRGQTLLQHAIDVGLSSLCSEVILVLGADEAIMRTGINTSRVKTVVNSHWEDGMSTSIKAGLEALLNIEPNTSQAIVMLCDQPFVDTALLNKLIKEKEETGKAIVACTYDNTLGTPALFDKSIFPELFSLEGSHGAKNIILTHNKEVVSIPFALGNVDIDTVEDYEKLKGYEL